MLVQFTVSNYLSFNEETTFSMVADTGDQKHLSHLIHDARKNGRSVLRAAAIYGANAAGKSNLIKAIQFARDRILKGSRGSEIIPVDSFRLRAANPERPSSFEFILRHHDTTYSYGFRADRFRIHEEWLFATSSAPRSREILLFERTTDPDGKTKIDFGSHLAKGEKQKQFLEFVAEGTRQNQLFLTEAFDRNVEAVRPVIDWFQDVLVIISAESKNRSLEVMTHMDTSYAQFLGDFLREAATGVDAIRVRELPVDFDAKFSDLPEDAKEELLRNFNNIDQDEIGEIHIAGQRSLLARNTAGELVQLQLKTIHTANDGSEVEFRLDEESDGTQRLTHLIPLLRAMSTQNKVVIMDELDRRLHPLLCRRFVEAALLCGNAENHNQIIFTTHDTNLLDLDLLRRDEIWFVEKDTGGASHIYSLAEFDIRPDLKISKGYLNGRFGAIPFLGDVCRILGTQKEVEAITEAG